MTERGNRKIRIGKVVSDKMDKTIVVAVEEQLRHSRYGKIIKKTNNFKAHDETNQCKIGDTVQIMEVRPLSRDKRWRLMEVLQKVQ